MFLWVSITLHPLLLSILTWLGSWSSLKLMSIESVMPSSHLILCRRGGFLTRQDEDLREPLVRCQGSQVLLRCAGKSGNPFQTTQGNRLSCRDQEGPSA